MDILSHVITNLTVQDMLGIGFVLVLNFILLACIPYAWGSSGKGN